MSRPARGEYWNHNTHYHGTVLSAVPRGCREALDVGCGDGLLVRRLANRAGRVTGLDRSPEMVAKARELSAGIPNVDFVEADVLEYDVPGDGYDFVCSVTTIHHMDFGRGLTALRDAVRPGGSLVVISLANNAGAADHLIAAGGLAAHYVHLLRHGGRQGDPGAPIVDPAMTWREVREQAARVLPGVRYRRHLLWRYSLIWTKPR
ncbi:class I SAM-dependent methyltransferase [Spirillospora sp. CA-294931]|uniref:class I SAM-dependent methyltransferase n=1 Tax=Spirillospora sp. CA-294931 TaxID=3240042 RepID=UPI003D8B58B5